MDKKTVYRSPMDENLFEEEFTIETLSDLGNPLERLSALVDFEMFRPILEETLLTKVCKTPAGRKPIDVVLLFKIIFLQRYYGLSDHQIQYQIVDRTSFRQFLCIHTVSEIPDKKTVWACRDRLSKAGTFDSLSNKFRSYLDSLGLSFNEGKIIDATFVEGAMNGSLVRSIGMVRAIAANAPTCLVYNIFRYEQLHRCQPAIIKLAQASVRDNCVQ